MAVEESFSQKVHAWLDMRRNACGRASQLRVEGEGLWSLAMGVPWEGLGSVRIAPAALDDSDDSATD